ncbi:uncharacterized protein LOC134742038 [Cydia strobilella]|uniref:uncharacterized protein LOC134742038 n=1 Tax=Cydia strobilella TaxID=1100964 RepID=UPI0030061364
MFKGFAVFALAFASARGHLAWPGGDFQAVQGLYIKPSSDGTTGDLYVAATEDNGVSSQWLTDQPVNFLAAGSHPKPTALPLFSALSSNALPLEESTSTQKRAAITGPAAKYAYGLPAESGYSSYGYAGIQSPKSEAVPATATKPEASTIASGSAVTQYPYNYLYPHMVQAAYSSALKVLKDAGVGSEDASNNNVVAPYPTSYWPASYYPMHYIMMDPTAWAKKHAAALTTTTAATSVDSDEENTKPE